MAFETTETVDCDILIIGGGMSGCGAAFEARYWAGSDKRVVLAEKAVIERSGATGEGLSAINCYMGQRYGWNTPEDFVNYVVNDMMGLAREDLVYDVGRHVDNSVHLLEEWGLPIWKQENGQYERIGRWQIPIHGESIKPIAAEPARAALGPENIYERVAITHLLKDDDDPDKIAGAVGFSVRDNKFYVFRSPVLIITTGGASNVFRPRSVSEGLGRTWYSVFATGSAYGLMIPAGVEMTQMEHRFVLPASRTATAPSACGSSTSTPRSSTPSATTTLSPAPPSSKSTSPTAPQSPRPRRCATTRCSSISATASGQCTCAPTRPCRPSPPVLTAPSTPPRWTRSAMRLGKTSST